MHAGERVDQTRFARADLSDQGHVHRLHGGRMERRLFRPRSAGCPVLPDLKMPAVRVGPAAEPAAVHLDQVKAHLPDETEIDHRQHFGLQLGRDRVGRHPRGP